jgi:hypothetical protein
VSKPRNTNAGRNGVDYSGQRAKAKLSTVWDSPERIKRFSRVSDDARATLIKRKTRPNNIRAHLSDCLLQERGHFGLPRITETEEDGDDVAIPPGVDLSDMVELFTSKLNEPVREFVYALEHPIGEACRPPIGEPRLKNEWNTTLRMDIAQAIPLSRQRVQNALLGIECRRLLRYYFLLVWLI